MIALARPTFVQTLADELREQHATYSALTDELVKVLARMAVKERAVIATRNHLLAALQETATGEPADVAVLLHQVRFLGWRLAEACIVLLGEQGTMSVQDLEQGLSEGSFRFRTPAPAKEIQAALLRHPHVRRQGDKWSYDGPRSSTGDGAM